MRPHTGELRGSCMMTQMVMSSYVKRPTARLPWTQFCGRQKGVQPPLLHPRYNRKASMKPANLPPALMNLSLLAGVGSALLAGATGVVLVLVFVLGQGSYHLAAALASIPLWWTVIVGVVIAVASTQTLESKSARMFGKKDDGTIPWHYWLPFLPFHAATFVVMWGYRLLASEEQVSKIEEVLQAGIWAAAQAESQPITSSAAGRRAVRIWLGAALLAALLAVSRQALQPDGLPPEQMEEGVRWAQAQHDEGRPVYTYCTHGHSRSAVMVCAILIAEGLAHDPADARRRVEERRPGVRPNKRQWRSLDAWFKKYHSKGSAADEGGSAAEQVEGGESLAQCGMPNGS